jgi:aminopeptidase N
MCDSNGRGYQDPQLTTKKEIIMRALQLSAFLCLIGAYGGAQSVFPVRDEGQARDKVYDVLHYVINVSIDDLQKEVTGTVTATLVPYLPECRVIEFDAEQMNIRRVMLRGKSLSYEVRPKTLAIMFDHPYSFRDTLVLAIDYSCKPTKGLYFVQPDSAYPDKPWQVWSQGEDMDNHFWFPCYDFPNDRATTELIATVRSKYTVLSNGALVSTREDKKSGMTTFHWKERHPYVSYLVMIAVGEYTILRDTAGTLPLEYYVYPHHIADARICFSKTPEMRGRNTRRCSSKISSLEEWKTPARRPSPMNPPCMMRARASMTARPV